MKLIWLLLFLVLSTMNSWQAAALQLDANASEANHGGWTQHAENVQLTGTGQDKTQDKTHS